MAEAKRDRNYIPTLIGTSNSDGSTPTLVYVDSATNRLLVSATFSGTTVSEFAEDDVHTSGDKGVMALAVRQDTQVDFGANGDYVPLSIDADGALRVSGGGGTQYATGANQTTPTGTVALGHDGASVIAVKVDNSGELQIDVLTLPALIAGSAEIGSVISNLGATDTANLASIANDTGTVMARLALLDEMSSSLATLDNPVVGGEMVVAQNTSSSLNAQVVGNIAHDTAVSGNPLQIAGEARSTERTAVGSADVSRLITDLAGKLIILPYANPEIFLRGREETTAAAGTNQLIASQGASTRIYVTSVIVSNASATDSEVNLQEGGSTILATIPAPDAGGAVMNFPVPIKLTENTALGFSARDAVSTITVTALGYSGS